MPDPLIQIAGLSVGFPAGSGFHEVVSGLDLTMYPGEVLALVGESGSGKTVTALSITRLLPEAASYRSGRIAFRGQELLAMPEPRLRAIRGGQIAYVFQEPATALNPVFTVGFQIAESLRLHGLAGPAEGRVGALLLSVGLPDAARIAASYPHQLSGGQQQRVMLAMALAGEPDLLIADEPTTALDVTIQAQILELLSDLRKARGLAVLLITHNLAIAAKLADRICVMYAGQIVETGPAREVIASPRHPYTAALIKAVPRLRAGGEAMVQGIPGHIPVGEAWPAGCRFHPRCAMARASCREGVPDLRPILEGRASRCYFAGEVGR